MLRRVRYVCGMNVRRFHLFIASIVIALVLSACGKEIDRSPTAVPTVPREATPAGLTAGQLADRIAVGWAAIDRYRAQTSTYTVASPAADDPTMQIVEEAILPDQRHQVVTVDGEMQSEIVAAGGNIYGRGPAIPGVSQPNRDPNVWITINGNVLGPNNPQSGFYQSLLLPVEPPYSGLSETDRARPVEEVGSVDVGGRACEQYRIVDTSQSGQRIEILIALQESGLVCSIQTTAGSSTTLTVYTYGQPAEIAIPASPAPAPAENG